MAARAQPFGLFGHKETVRNFHWEEAEGIGKSTTDTAYLPSLAIFSTVLSAGVANAGVRCAAEIGECSVCPRIILGEQLLYYIARNVRQPEITALEAVRQARVVETQQLQDRCVQVVHVHLFLYYVEA